MSDLNVVTGATGYSGKYITRRLVDSGHRVRTLTGHPNRPNPFGSQIEIVPFHFENPEQLRKDLQGVGTLYNTYWVRFSRGRRTYAGAVANTRMLIHAAEQAGVRKFVHVSIANPSADSPLPYYRGKAALEVALAESSLSWAIVRPTVIFGLEDILINNMAWLVRHFPVFAVPGSGEYRLQPVYAEDLAEIATNAASNTEDVAVDAVGPETYTFNEIVLLIARALGRRRRLAHVPSTLAYLLTRLLGPVIHDVMLTREEIKGLMSNLLVSHQPPLGRTSLAEWIEQNAGRVGRHYTSELGRHFR
jgi:uncharacterized protein YbjT (DUF2867 family)